MFSFIVFILVRLPLHFDAFCLSSFEVSCSLRFPVILLEILLAIIRKIRIKMIVWLRVTMKSGKSVFKENFRHFL